MMLFRQDWRRSVNGNQGNDETATKVTILLEVVATMIVRGGKDNDGSTVTSAMTKFSASRQRQSIWR